MVERFVEASFVFVVMSIISVGVVAMLKHAYTVVRSGESIMDKAIVVWLSLLTLWCVAMCFISGLAVRGYIS